MHAVNSTLAAGKPLLAMRFEDHVMNHTSAAGNAFLINKGAHPLYKNTDLKALFDKIAPISSDTKDVCPMVNERLSLFD